MDILKRFERILRGRYWVTVLELGMCDGYHSNELLKIIKAQDRPFTFHGFEPNTELHHQILNNIKGHMMFNDGVIGIFHSAVGNEVGEMPFYKSRGVKVELGKEVDWYYGSSSIKKPTKNIQEDFVEMEFEESKVFVTTLDHHCTNHFTNPSQRFIDFIWADIQGAELDMIEGARDTLTRTRYLYTEYNNAEHYEGQAIGLEPILKALPNFIEIEDYGGDVLLKNKFL